MKDIFRESIDTLMSHADGNFVSKQDALDAGMRLHNLMVKFDQWHWIEHALNEVQRAENKHPDWPKDAIYALAIIGEEYGEAMREAVKIEMNEGDKSLPNLKRELIQVIATCLRALKNL